MAELKTKKNKKSVTKFIDSIADEQKRKDSHELLKIFEQVTKEKATMRGDSIIGFGEYHYKSERSSQEGDWPLTGFSPRKANLTLYIMSGTKNHPELIDNIGKCKTSVGCLYIKKLADVDIKLLKKLIKDSVKAMKKMYNVK